MALSVRCIQPIQQQGRRIPSFSSEITRLICSSLVFCCFTVTVQQIHSFRAKGVKLCHATCAAGAEISAFLKSAGVLCTVPSAISFFAINLFYLVRRQIVLIALCSPASRMKSKLFCRLFSYRNFCCYPNIIRLAFISKFFVFFEILTRLKVTRYFPSNFTHRLAASWTLHR